MCKLLHYFCTIVIYLSINGFCKKPGMMVLTFDDGVSYNYKRLLEILEYENVKATFFVIGNTLTNPENMAILKEAYKKGHTIGNHTWSHYNLTKIQTQVLIKEIEETQNGINLATNTNYPKYIRSPYGEVNENVKKIFKKLGYTEIRWNLDAMDWNLKKSKKDLLTYYDNIFNNYPASKTNFISLQHDRRNVSIEILPYILKLARTKGYEIVSLEECLNMRSFY